VLNHGLAAALDSLAGRSTVPTRVLFELLDPLPAPVELAAYFVASEALANVAKYAGDSSAVVRAWPSGPDVMSISIADTGAGGADAERGSGIRGLADRVEALGGHLRVVSPPGEGTVITAEFPCGS
jgi:signal transduction histidine kinase